MNGWVLVYSIGAAQGALLAFALWRRPVNAPGNRLLAIWIALATLDLAIRATYLAAPGPEMLKPYRLVTLFPFLHGSLFYLYVRTLITQRILRWRDCIHFIGFALVVAAYSDLLLLDAVATAALYRDLAVGWVPARARYLDLLMMVYCLSYVVAALNSLVRYRRALLARRSDVDPAALRWLSAMALSQVLIWVIALGQWLTPMSWLSYRLIYAGVAVWVFVVGYFSLVQPPVPVVGGAAGDSDPAAAEAPEAVAADRAAQDGRFPEVAARLEQLMGERAVYREPALSIGQLARRSGYPEYLVSAVINRSYGCHFWDYVNRYRIEAARACLADPGEVRTALEIAYDVGFTSKSTFNAAFKRVLGQTPSQYRTQHAGGEAGAATAHTTPG